MYTVPGAAEGPDQGDLCLGGALGGDQGARLHLHLAKHPPRQGLRRYNMIILVTMVTMNLVVGDEAGDGGVRVAGPRPSAHQLVQTLGAGQVLQ